MASSSVTENWVMINGDIDSSEGSDDQISEISSAAFLISLLEETQGEDYDKERLSSLIQSLEAEIDPNRMNGGDTSMDPMMGANIYEPCDEGQVEGHDCWAADLISWNNIDMEMGSPSTSSSNIHDDDISFWYPIGEQMDVMAEFGGVRNCSQIYSGVHFDHANFHLWQEPCDGTMYS